MKITYYHLLEYNIEQRKKMLSDFVITHHVPMNEHKIVFLTKSNSIQVMRISSKQIWSWVNGMLMQGYSRNNIDNLARDYIHKRIEIMIMYN